METQGVLLMSSLLCGHRNCRQHIGLDISVGCNQPAVNGRVVAGLRLLAIFLGGLAPRISSQLCRRAIAAVFDLQCSGWRHSLSFCVGWKWTGLVAPADTGFHSHSHAASSCHFYWERACAFGSIRVTPRQHYIQPVLHCVWRGPCRSRSFRS